jgi:hypothetical protein
MNKLEEDKFYKKIRFVLDNDKTSKIIFRILYERIKTVVGEKNWNDNSFWEEFDGTSKIKNRH